MGVTSKELEHESEVPDTTPDEDWATRFFSYAEDVSSSQMQDLWGRILAGKIKRPDSYSMRTLDFVRSMSQADAEALAKAASLAIREGGDRAFILTSIVGSGKPLDFELMLMLGEIGLVVEESNLQMQLKLPAGQKSVFVVGTEALVLTSNDKEVVRSIAIRPFTKIGRELLELVQPSSQPVNVKELVPLLYCESSSVLIGSIKERLMNGKLQLTNTRIFTGDEVMQMKAVSGT